MISQVLIPILYRIVSHGFIFVLMFLSSSSLSSSSSFRYVPVRTVLFRFYSLCSFYCNHCDCCLLSYRMTAADRVIVIVIVYMVGIVAAVLLLSSSYQYFLLFYVPSIIINTSIIIGIISTILFNCDLSSLQNIILLSPAVSYWIVEPILNLI